MKKHVASFDYLRVFACLLVLLCHWTQSVGHAEWAGCLSGGTGNTLFFALSGLLLGAASAGGGGYKLDFFKKRILRLYPAFFLLLVVHIGVLYGTGVRLPARSLILNFLGLSWFAHLPGTRHLWFVTGIAGLYALLFALSHMGARRWGVPLCCAGLLALQVLLKAVGISQGSYCSLLLAGVLGFACGPYVERISARTPRGLRIASLPVALAVYGLVCTALNGISPGHVPFYWAAFACAGLMVACAVLNADNLPPPPRIVGFLGGISYEIYLVHHPLCIGPLSLARLHLPTGLYFLVFCVLTVVLSYGLHLGARAIVRAIPGSVRG